MKKPIQILETYWGHPQFLPMQEEIISNVLNGRDTVALLPTGGGKSVCFQLPALLFDGITLVISPLIALMKDQVDGLKANGIEADFYNSSQEKFEQDAIFDMAYGFGQDHIAPHALLPCFII